MDLLKALGAVVGTDHVLSGDVAETWLTERRGTFTPRARAVVMPGDTDQVAGVVRACNEADAAIVPQSGNTGLVGGTAASDCRHHVMVNLRRMNAVRDVNVDDMTMTVEAGCRQAEAHDAAAASDLYFPLTLPSRNECCIGGNLGTNAGGLNVVHYGNTRDLVLGLEVVLADGRIWNGLKGLRKDNSGFDFKDLFIGSEARWA